MHMTQKRSHAVMGHGFRVNGQQSFAITGGGGSGR